MKSLFKNAKNLTVRAVKKLKRVKHIKTWTFLFCVVFAVIMLLASTLAWFTAADTRENKLPTPPPSNFDVTLVDVFEPPNLSLGPDDAFAKRVAAQNSGNIGAFVRILLAPVIIGSDGVSVLPATIGPYESATSVNPTIIMTDYDDTLPLKWIPGEDGYWYYTDYLPAGATSADIFKLLRLNPNLDEIYINSTLKIECKVEAAETGNYRFAWWGIPPTSPCTKTLILSTIDAILQTKIP